MADHSAFVEYVAAGTQALGAALMFLGVVLLLCDRNNPYLIYLFPASLLLLGLSVVLTF